MRRPVMVTCVLFGCEHRQHFIVQTARYRAAEQTLYATPTALVPIARQSRLRVNDATCDGGETPVPPDGCCTSVPSAIIFAGPAITVPVGGFVRPFRYNQR